MTRGLAALLAVAALPAAAPQFVPPAGYGGHGTGPAVAPNPAPDAPALAAVPLATVQALFRLDPSYHRADHAKVVVIGAYAVAERPGHRLTGAWGPGYLPVTLAFGDGRCFAFQAAYEGPVLSDARLAPASCAERRGYEAGPPPAAPAGLRPLGMPWGFGVWVDDRAGTTTIGAPQAEAFEPLFVARFAASAVMAMNSPDAPLADLTLVGRIGGRLTVVTVELVY